MRDQSILLGKFWYKNKKLMIKIRMLKLIGLDF